MHGIIAYFRGFGFKCLRPAIYAWFFNFLFTIFIYYGYYLAFSIPAGRTLIPFGNDALGKSNLSTFTFLADILGHYKGSLPLVFSLALVYTFVFFIVSVYVSGGIYAVLVEDEKTTFTNLIASSTHNFSSMFKISLVNLINLIAALIIPGLLLLFFFATRSMYANETFIQFFSWLWLIVTALFLTFSTAVYDFSRIYKLREDKGIFYSFKQGILFVLANKLAILLLFITYGTALALIYLGFILTVRLQERLPYAILLFLVYQAFIMVRYYLKIVAMRAEVRF
ncbi:MAG: hypothetical protein MUF15_08460 [Acidobacteria bacterium]|jgi:hypothetical protein|nr:hypothetical protein [Acidobacteriota bacterium]